MVAEFNRFEYFQSNDNMRSVIFLESMIFGHGAFILALFANEIGQRFSNVFMKIGDAICELNWHLNSIGIQRIILILIINVQEPVAIRLFGSAVCSREQFRKVSIHTEFCKIIE